MDHAEPTQPINNTDKFHEEKNTEPEHNKGRRREMKVGLRRFLKLEESQFLYLYLFILQTLIYMLYL